MATISACPMLDARFSMLGSRFDKHQRQIHFNFEQFPAASVADDSSFHSPYLAPTEAGLASCATSRNMYAEIAASSETVRSYFRVS